MKEGKEEGGRKDGGREKRWEEKGGKTEERSA